MPSMVHTRWYEAQQDRNQLIKGDNANAQLARGRTGDASAAGDGFLVCPYLSGNRPHQMPHLCFAVTPRVRTRT